MKQVSKIDQSRAQFEAWYKGGVVGWKLRFHRDSTGKHAPYSFTGIESAWQAWQASREALESGEAELCKSST